mgnify:CR=1 FL=1
MASTPRIDRYRSIITTDAIRNWMSNYLKNPVILLWHNSDKPIWTMTDHKVDNSWLHITAKLVRNVDSVFENIRDWITKGFSIGFIPLDRVYKTKDWVPLQSLTSEELDNLDYNDVIREITEIDLVEISVCNTPANADALFTMARAIKAFFEEQEKRSFWLMWMMTRDTDNADKAEDKTDTAEQTETQEDQENTEDEEADDEDNEDDENDEDETEDTAEVTKCDNWKLSDEDFKAVEDDEDEDEDEEDDTDDEQDTEDTDEEEQATQDQSNSDDNSGQEVESAGESPAEVAKADDESPQEQAEQRNFNVNEVIALRKVIDDVIDTLSVLSEEISTLKTDNVELRTQNADLINRLSNMPMYRWLKTLWWLWTNKKNSEWSTIITTLKQAKRDAWVGWDEDDD